MKLFSALLLLSLFAKSIAFADSVEVEIRESDELIRAEAHVFSDVQFRLEQQQTTGEDALPHLSLPETTQRVAKIISHSGDTWKIDVTVLPEDFDSLLLVTGIRGDGIATVAPVLRVGNKQSSRVLLGECKLSESIRQAQSGINSQETSVNDLIKLRTNRRNLLREKFKALLVPERIEHIRTEELRYGLRYDRPLSEDLPFEEWVLRLTTLDVLRQSRRK